MEAACCDTLVDDVDALDTTSYMRRQLGKRRINFASTASIMEQSVSSKISGYHTFVVEEMVNGY